jgi:hypothetical protein
VRHHLVQRIIRAYDEHKTKLAEQQLSLLELKSGNGKTNGADNPPVQKPVQKNVAMPMEADAKE